MNNFKVGGFKKQSSGYDGRSKAGGHRGAGARGGGSKSVGTKPTGRPADLFQATCSTCHKDCMLPFRPNTDKPVYCSDCFSKKNSDSSDGRAGKFQRPERTVRPDRPSTQDLELKAIRAQLKVVEDRLNRVLDIISPPTPPKKAADK